MSENDLIAALIDQIAHTSGLEGLAVITAIGYVLLAAKQNIACWLFALISTVCYTVLFWQVSLPFQTALNGYYVFMAIYGFWQWQKGSEHHKPVTALTARQNMTAIGAIILVTGLVATIWQEIAFTKFVYVDVFVTVGSVVTTILVAHKKLQNWLYWIVINVIAAWLYWQVDLFLTSGLFLLYCGLSIYGYWQWKKENPMQVNAS